ncbi:Glucose-1-phosphate thymidylyltransferase [Pseudomonas chlororaphis]|nr:Glucose-1-phosphate thymidylyltransferase [Pseudomonas chlororaphis]
MLGRGFAWLDTGTHESLREVSHFVHTIELRQGLKVACLEEIAYNFGWITPAELGVQAERLKKTDYDKYLKIYWMHDLIDRGFPDCELFVKVFVSCRMERVFISGRASFDSSGRM